MGVFTPYISLLFRAKGYSLFDFGIIMGGFNLSGIVGPLIITGLLQKKQNYRLTLLSLLIGMALFIVLLGMYRSFWTNFVCLFMFGLFMNSVAPVMEVTYINNLYNPYREYGIVRTIASVGYVLIALLVAFFPVVNAQSEFSIVRLAVVGYVLVACGIFFIPKRNEEVVSVGRDYKSSFLSMFKEFDSRYFVMLGFVGANFIGLRTIDTFIGLYAIEKFGLENVTVLFAVSVGAELVVLFYGQRIVKKIGYIVAWLLVLGATSLRLLGLGLFNNVLALYITQSFHIMSFGLMLSTFIYYVNYALKARSRAVAMGLFQSVASTASIIVSVLGGYLLSKFGFSSLFLYMSGIPLLGLVAVFLFMNKIKISSVTRQQE